MRPLFKQSLCIIALISLFLVVLGCSSNNEQESSNVASILPGTLSRMGDADTLTLEGEIVNLIQDCRNKCSGVIINAAGYTHTSVSILDALKVLKIPIIELHITNIYNREEFRHKSLISKVSSGVICGFGVKGYIMALEAIKDLIKK